MVIVEFFDYGDDKDVRFPGEQTKSGEELSSPLGIYPGRYLSYNPAISLKRRLVKTIGPPSRQTKYHRCCAINKQQSRSDSLTQEKSIQVWAILNR